MRLVPAAPETTPWKVVSVLLPALIVRVPPTPLGDRLMLLRRTEEGVDPLLKVMKSEIMLTGFSNGALIWRIPPFSTSVASPSAKALLITSPASRLINTIEPAARSFRFWSVRLEMLPFT